MMERLTTTFDTLINVRFEVLSTACVTIIAFVVWILWKRRRRNFPPGPLGLPIVGYIPFMSKNSHLDFMMLAKKYGDVFSVRLGSETMVVLSSTKSAREALVKPEIQERPANGGFNVLDYKSSFFMHGVEMWQEQRKFVVQVMKDLGLGKSKIEDQIQEEIGYLIEVIRGYNGNSMPFGKLLAPSVSNNICSLLFGARSEYDDPERKKLDDNLDKVVNTIGQTALHVFFPWIKQIPFLFKWLNYHTGALALTTLKEVFREKVRQHKESLDPRNPRDLIDNYLIEIENKKRSDSHSSFTEDTLANNIFDFFGAGSETVRTTISWCIYTMAAYPDMQKKLQKEIMDVVGSERSPKFLDLKLMPYTHAVILEILRWKTPVPIDILRCNTEDTTVGGYDIPEGTTVTANIWAIHNDPEVWDDPDSYKPERFLTPDGKSVQKPPSYMPFSLGKRVCPGEAMAYMEVFLYVVAILQKFDVKFPEGVKPTFEAQLCITYQAKPYELCFISKN